MPRRRDGCSTDTYRVRSRVRGRVPRTPDVREGVTAGTVPAMVSRKRVLIIEDDADMRVALRDAMSDAGLLADLAADGAEGLARLREGLSPSLILLDLRMPRLCGEDFLRAIRDDELFDHIPVITMTAGADPEEPGDVVAHLHKPFDLEDLLQIVLSVVGATAA